MADDLIARIRARADDPPFPTVSASAVADAERRLGFGLPSFLAQVYQEVGNGGFGPGSGVIGLPGGFPSDGGKSIVELYVVVVPRDDSGIPGLAVAGWPCADLRLRLCDFLLRRLPCGFDHHVRSQRTARGRAVHGGLRPIAPECRRLVRGLGEWRQPVGQNV